MPSFTEQFTEGHIPLAVIHADSGGVGEHNTGYVDVSNYHRLFILIDVGDMGAGATFDADLEIATTVAGANAMDLKWMTQLTQAGGDGNDLIGFEVRGEEFVNADGAGTDFEFANLEITVAGAAVEFSAYIFGIIPRFLPVSAAGWTEIVQ